MGITTTLRMKQIEARRPAPTTHTRVHLEQADALDAARPASSADTIRQWHLSHIKLTGATSE